MKNILIIMLGGLIIMTLSSCSVLRDFATNIGIIDTVEFDGVTYRTGFYDGDLWPENIEHKGEPYKIGHNTYQRVDNDKYDWVHTVTGDFDNKTLYCVESQWENARVFYEDSANFTYYCKIGANYIDRDPIVVTIPDIDPVKFNELMVFAEKNCYDPFGSNKGKQIIRLPIPDRDESPELVFYRESNDGFFRSFTHHFFVVGDNFLLLYFYDYGHGEYEELAAVEIPGGLGEYFLKLYAKITSLT